MIFRKLKTQIVYSVSAFALTISLLGCGEDPGMYQGETLTFETPISSKRVKERTNENKKQELDLGANESHEFFRFIERGPFLIPWGGPIPFFDYYLMPFPLEVPVSPFYSVIEFIHPFYAAAGFPFFNDDDFFFEP